MVRRCKSEHTRVSGETACAFVRDVIFGATRRLPIVLVSENRYRTNLLNLEFLQSRLLGLANVVAFDDESAQVLNAELRFIGVLWRRSSHLLAGMYLRLGALGA